MTTTLAAPLSTLSALVVCLCLSLTAGCYAPPPPPPPAAAGQPLHGDGPRCKDAHCSCRAIDENGNSLTKDEGDVTPGYKRYEIRTGRSLDELSVDIEGHGTLVKEAGTPEPACAYVDLAPGHYRLRLHGKASTEAGMVPSLFVYEYGTRTHDWYWTYQFRCGDGSGNDVCTQGDLDTLATDAKKSLFDPCGSTKVEGDRWQGRHGAGQQM